MRSSIERTSVSRRSSGEAQRTIQKRIEYFLVATMLASLFVFLVIASRVVTSGSTKTLYRSDVMDISRVDSSSGEFQQLMSFIATDDAENYSNLVYSETSLFKSWWMRDDKIPDVCHQLPVIYADSAKDHSKSFKQKLSQALEFDLPIGDHVRYVQGTFSTIANGSEARKLHRNYLKTYDNVYDPLTNADGTFLVVFVVGLPRTEDELETVLKEQALYQDVVVLSSFEAVNCGKTYDWFRYAWERILRNRSKIWAVGKSDLDTFVRYIAVERELNRKLLLSRQYNLYWGWDMTKPGFMHGLCYYLSRSNVHFVAQFPPLNKTENSLGVEDHLTGWWMEVKNRATKWETSKIVQFIHDTGFHEWKDVDCGGQLCNNPSPSTYALHRCKTEEQFKYLRNLWPDQLIKLKMV
jgi:hypothetical protein